MENSDFVAHMEQVLDVYKDAYNEAYPVVCMDESPKQLIKETRVPIKIKPGSERKEDYEYERYGVTNIFMDRFGSFHYMVVDCGSGYL